MTKKERKLFRHNYYLKHREKEIDYSKRYNKKHNKKVQKYMEIYRKINKKKLLKTDRRYKKIHRKEIIKYRKLNRQMLNEINRIYYLKNKQKIAKYGKKWKQLNKEKLNKRYINRLKTDINLKIRKYLQTRIWSALRGIHKSVRTMELIGCTIEQLRRHLKKQFKPGMSWSNYGKWHVDHIIPCASFDLSKSEEQRKCFHYTNLQPLWAEENIIKSDKL